MIDLPAYYKRIGYSGPVRVDLETLQRLHRAHCNAIPYENFDVQLKRPMTIDPHAAFDKIVHRRRGGWCYELNGVFGLAMKAIGFDVRRLAADGSTNYSHLVLTVKLDDVTYVCDVGFADGPAEPYALQDGAFTQGGFEFRVEHEANGRWRMHNHRFGLAPGFFAGGPNEAEMEKTCQWLQTSVESPFVQHATVCRRTTGGYISLVDRTLRRIAPDGVTRTTINNADEYVGTLKSHFDLDLPETASLWPSLCERHEVYLRESAARRAAKTAQSLARVE